jgi:hypothetical protein
MTDASKRGRNARRKGAQWERDICGLIHDEFGIRVQRRTDGPRGHCEDVSLPPFSIEAKFYERIASLKWLDQAATNAPIGTLPVVVMRENGRTQPAVMMPWWVFAQLARGELIGREPLPAATAEPTAESYRGNRPPGLGTSAG